MNSPFFISFSNSDVGLIKEKEFWISCRKGDLEKVKELAKQMTDINWSNEKKESKTGLHIACDQGRIEIVQYLLTLPQIQVNQGDTRGITPLHLACLRGREEIVKILLRDERVDLNQGDQYERSPLNLACLRGREEIVKILLRDERVNVNQCDREGKTPLHIACEQRNEEIVKLLLRNGRTGVNQEDARGRTPLWITCKTGEDENVKFLLANRRRIDVTNKSKPGDEDWNNLSATEIARLWTFHEIADLIDEYERNPKEVMIKLRYEFGKNDYFISFFFFPTPFPSLLFPFISF